MNLVPDVRQPVQRDRLLRLPQVEELTGLKKSTLYRMAREGRFVKPVQVTPRVSAWPESRVLEWVQGRIAAAEAAERAAAA
ncbi:MAG: AlpA family transcriptional regulator [Rubrivivax sp.]|nr:AlpA family transcriptional regulator [Rubrivivax sp.]